MKRYQTSESLPVGLLLALAGGILDAYTYLNRGQVFATAETGNLVLLGINLSQGKLDRVVYYLLPILSFAAGVLVTELLRRRLGPNAGHLHWRQPVLLTECLVLVLVSLLPVGPLDPLANMLISFTSAIQIESFRQFQGCGCATTMCTGNLRSAADNLYAGLALHDAPALLRASRYLSVVLVFVLGAVAGAFLTQALAEKAVLLCTLPLLAAFGVMFLPTGEAAP